MTQLPPNYIFYRADNGYLACDILVPNPEDYKSQKMAPHNLVKSPLLKDMPPEHRKIIMQLAMHCDERSLHKVLRGGNGFTLAKAIIMTGRAYWVKEKSRPLQWQDPCWGELIWKQGDSDLLLPSISLTDKPDLIFPANPPLCLYISSGKVCPLEATVPGDIICEWVTPRPAMVYQAALDFYRVQGARHPEAVLPLPPAKGESVIQNIAPTPCLLVSSQILDKNSPGMDGHKIPIVKLSFDYGVDRLLPSDYRQTIVATKDGNLIQCVRDQATEASAMERLRIIGFRPLEEISPQLSDMAKGRDWFLAPDSPHDWAAFLATVSPELSGVGWTIDFSPDCPLVTVADDDWYSELDPNPKGWFELEVGIRIGGKRVSLLPVIQQFLAQNRSRSLTDIRRYLTGRKIPVAMDGHGFALIAGDRLLVVVEHLVDLFDRAPKPDEVAKPQGDRIRLDMWRAAEIGQMEKWASSPWNRPEALRSLSERLARVNDLDPIPGPASLRASLRPYQQWGLAWLQFLQEAAFDGVLADDMGLGKTIQTLAHLLLEKEAGRLEQPCLIICPTSVIQNWSDEAQKFAPSLRLLVSHGSDRREVHAGIPDADIVLTSYALLRQDAEFLQSLTFSLVILDEAQYIKNHRAQTAQAACALKSTRRLCLTGTPMENHLGELWALFNFLMPGFLGSAQAFNSRFRHPIEQEGRDLVRRSLSQRVAPFMLRRLKSQVEKDLPAKTEMVHRVELSPVQRELYESVRLAMQARIQEEIASRGLGRSHITILDGLLKLRQVCCDPRLLKHNDTARASAVSDSAKLQALVDMVTEMIEEGRKILIFSQFVEMLDLIQVELKRLGLKYSLLTGSTTDRVTPVRQFQAGETSLFLISLKAGGTGLNLTAADTVIHYDPWWNPAAARQATDRAHRIGQTKPIFVYRFLTVGTVEARIQSMQDRKQKLADSILKEQSADSVKFTLEDIESLFASIGE